MTAARKKLRALMTGKRLVLMPGAYDALSARIIEMEGFEAIVAGGSLCLLLTVNEFGIVLFIGAKGVITLPLLIYSKAIQESDYQGACAIAIVNVALSLILFTVYRFAARRLGG